MSNVNTLLTKRLDKKEKSSKMLKMAEQSAAGNLTGFSGIFNQVELNDSEKDYLEAILYEFTTGKENISHDLKSLITITSEVKTINNQAAILHGERIKKAQDVLKKYKEGAFTAWLIGAYGNRQTPYNFLQYYEFYLAMPKSLRPQIELMPRQAIYTLASRVGSIDKKRQIIEGYKGETKSIVLHLIREIFPLPKEDKRKENFSKQFIGVIEKLTAKIHRSQFTITKASKKTIFKLLDELYNEVERCKTR